MAMAVYCRMLLYQYIGAVRGIQGFRCMRVRSLSSLPPLMSKPLKSEDSLVVTVHNEITAVQSEAQISNNKKAIDGHFDEVNKVISQLSQLVLAGQSDYGIISKLHADPIFKAISERVIFVSTSMNVNQLLNAMTLLLPVCSTDCIPMMESLQNRALSIMQKHISVSRLVQIVKLHNNAATELGRKVGSEAWQLLEKRWVEIINVRDILALLYVASENSGQLLARLEDKALVMCESFKTKELYRVLYVQARRRRRNAPLIRAVVYHLSQRELDLGLVHLANLAFALSILNIRNERMMESLVGAVIASTSEQTSHDAVMPLLSSVIQSFGILRYRDDRLLDSVAMYFQNSQSLVTAVNWHQLLYGTAWLGYRPLSLRNNSLIEFTHAVCSPSLVNENPLLVLDIIWSCLVLSALTPNLAATVLDSAFISKALSKCGGNVVPFYMKLLNINSAVRTANFGYDGPLLSSELISHASSLISARKHDDLFNSVFEALSQMAPAQQYLSTDVKTTLGHVIDVELFVNSRIELQPLSVAAEPSNGLKTSSSSSSSSSGFHRIAILLHNYSDMTSGVVCPNGSCALAATLLSNEGFTVVQIPHAEFDVRATIVKRVQYLHQKMKDAIVLKSLQGSTQTVSQKQPNFKGNSPQITPRTPSSRTDSSTSDTSEVQVDAGLTGKSVIIHRSLKMDKSNDATERISESIGENVVSDSQQTNLGSAEHRDSTSVKLDIASLFSKEFEEKIIPKDSNEMSSSLAVDKTKSRKKK